MALAGYATTVRKTGTPTSMTSQAMSTFGSVANTYKVGSTARRIWNRSASFTFNSGSGTTAVAVISSTAIAAIDYLFGTVRFNSTQPEPVSVSGQYLPTAVVAGAHSYSLSQSRELLDNTDFESTGWRARQAGLLDVALSVTRWDSIDLDYFSKIDDDSEVVVDVRPGGGSLAARGFFKVESENRSGDVAALESAEVSFQLHGTTDASFSWGAP